MQQWQLPSLGSYWDEPHNPDSTWGDCEASQGLRGWNYPAGDGNTSPVTHWLANILQGEYSRQLYGAPGRMPADLRIIWLRGLDDATLVALPLACACVPLLPWQPFYYPMTEDHNPADALWVARGYEEFPAVADHAWAEVTHCVDRCTCRRSSSGPLLPLLRIPSSRHQGLTKGPELNCSPRCAGGGRCGFTSRRAQASLSTSAAPT